MMLREHPQRRELSDEVHARPPELLAAPLRVTYVAFFLEGEERRAGWQCVQNLATRFNAPVPHAEALHFSANLGAFRVKCERHTEFLRLKFIAEGTGDDPFSVPAIGAVPGDWLAALPGQLLVAANIALLKENEQHVELDALSMRFFDGNVLIGSSIGSGSAVAVTDFRIHPDGFSRFVVINRAMTSRQAGRMVQRLLEIDTYRVLSLLALPVARELTPILGNGERELADITRLLVAARDDDEPVLFDRLSRLAAEIESHQSRNLYRFSAAAAYEKLVQRRISELREERLPGLQTFAEFTVRRLEPAMNTCRAVAAQQESLSQHLARATQLLSTRVGITGERQNQRVLESMNRRAELQLRLQETVETLSIAAITYYIVGLVGYAARGARAMGIRLDADTAMAISIPIVIAVTAFCLRRIRGIATRGL